MKTLTQIGLFACLCMMTGIALAQDVVVPDLEHRRGMSYEEYSSIREKMRMRMDSKQSANNPNERENKSEDPVTAKGSYGRDYQSRNQVDRPDVKFERPERTQNNRPERPEVFRR